MNLLLLKLTALAMVATSGAHAADKPYMIRGSIENEDALVEVEASCSRGTRDGQKSVKKSWRKSGQDCDNVWNLEDDTSRMKNRKYPSNSRSWRTRAYNRCARDGVDQQVQKIEKECLDDPSQCQDLGQTAAEIIVFDNVCTPNMANSQAFGHDAPDYKETCREVAYGICSGYVSTTINTYCRDSKVSTTKLLELQRKCEDTVDSMVGDDELEFMVN